MDECNQEYQEISKLVKSELDRFDKDKVDDFRQSVEQFLASMIEHQKQAGLFLIRFAFIKLLTQTV